MLHTVYIENSSVSGLNNLAGITGIAYKQTRASKIMGKAIQ